MGMSAEIVSRAQSRLGTVLNGKWRLDEIVGVGGMATVYAAMHRNQKRVAVKMLHTELSLEEGVRTRFLREGYLANTVGHPGAVTVFDDDIAEDGSAFLVMELLEGETINSRVLREGALPVREALRMADEVLDVLVAAHAKRIIHRDLKPENLFITRDGHVKVLDFGIARLRELPFGSPSNTASGFFMGTPAFMAPEHARGKWSEVDALSDLWSVGATLFTMLTGKFVHESETAMDTLVMAVTRPAPSIRTVQPDLHPEVCALIDCALSFEKVDRFSSAVDMQDALRLVAAHLDADHSPGEERPPTTPAFASPPYTPLRVYHATVQSARPPAPQTFPSEAPLASSVPPQRGAFPSVPDRSGGVSVTDRAGQARPRQISTRWLAGVAVLLVALPAYFLLRRSPATSVLDELVPGAEPSPSETLVGGLDHRPSALEPSAEPLAVAAATALVLPAATAGLELGNAPDAAALAPPVKASAAAPAGLPPGALLAAHGPVRSRAPELRLLHPAALHAASQPSASALPSALAPQPSAAPPVIESSPFDRRF
jgi:serine/threonine protein kinase